MGMQNGSTKTALRKSKRYNKHFTLSQQLVREVSLSKFIIMAQRCCDSPRSQSIEWLELKFKPRSD